MEDMLIFVDICDFMFTTTTIVINAKELVLWIVAYQRLIVLTAILPTLFRIVEKTICYQHIFGERDRRQGGITFVLQVFVMPFVCIV